MFPSLSNIKDHWLVMIDKRQLNEERFHMIYIRTTCVFLCMVILGLSVNTFGQIERFRSQFDPNLASKIQNRNSPSETVYVVAVDKDRNVASYISSIFEYFGSGIVADGTGILMQNRGSLFSLDRNNPNCLEPGKRNGFAI